MSRIILISAVILLLTLSLLYRGLKTPQEKRRFWKRLGISSLLFVLIILVLTGRIHALYAGIVAILPFLRRMLAYLRYLPAIKKILGQSRQGSQSASQQGQQGQQQSGENKRQVNETGQMSRDEALHVLGLQAGASRQEVIDAHRRLMLKCHPDKGGSDYLAAKLNQAKDCLLKG